MNDHIHDPLDITEDKDTEAKQTNLPTWPPTYASHVSILSTAQCLRVTRNTILPLKLVKGKWLSKLISVLLPRWSVTSDRSGCALQKQGCLLYLFHISDDTDVWPTQGLLHLGQVSSFSDIICGILAWPSPLPLEHNRTGCVSNWQGHTYSSLFLVGTKCIHFGPSSHRGWHFLWAGGKTFPFWRRLTILFGRRWSFTLLGDNARLLSFVGRPSLAGRCASRLLFCAAPLSYRPYFRLIGGIWNKFYSWNIP